MNAAIPLVALIHGTRAAMAPAEEAIAAASGTRLWHLLDDRLMGEADEAGMVTPALSERMTALIAYAIAGGADAVQLTCSLYGSIADGYEGAVPVRSSDGAMLSRLVESRPTRIGLLASLASAADESSRRIAQAFAARPGTGDPMPEIVPIVIPGGLDLARQRAYTDLARAAETAVTGAFDERGFDALVLAQYTLSPVAAQLSEATGVTVYSPAQLMAQDIQNLVQAPSPAAQP